MKKILTITLLTLLITTAVKAQISDSQLISVAKSEMQSGTSEADLATKLMQRGATLDQIQRLRSQYAKQINSKGLGATADNSIDVAKERQRHNNEKKSEGDNSLSRSGGDMADQSTAAIVATETGNRTVRKVFGRDIFNNGQLTFEPQMNIATPQDYVLGPGDQLVIDVYGATQESVTLTVTPDGDVIVPDYGPIAVSGLTVASAQSRIRSKIGGYFSSSQIKVTVGQTRTISINVMGEVRTPGTYTLSAFATVFHALYKAGGINDLGTLRNIKVYRQGRQISVVDIYEFILNGRLAGNVRLQDNDVIQVGPYDAIVDISGMVKRPMSYEMRKDESLFTLIKYAGGFTGNAYRKSLRVFRNSELMKNVYNVEEFDFTSFVLNDGDAVSVSAQLDRYENMVEVKGAVFRPGMFRLGEKVTSVRSLVESADGLTEEALVSRAVIRRLKPNRTQEVISVDLEGIMNGTVADVPLKNEDVLFIPTMAEHQNLRTLTIGGEVIFPGTFEYADSMTLEDLILQAGGLTDLASTAKVDVTRRFRDASATTSGLDLAKTFSFSVDKDYKVDGAAREFILEPYDIVQVRRTPVFQDPINVSVSGEITFAGTYTMEKKNQRLSDLVKAAGGIVEGAYVRGARLVRHMTDAERARMKEVIQMARQNQDQKDSIALDKLETATTYTVGIHLDEAINNPGSTKDVELVDGDQLIIPRFNHTVKINGDVMSPNTVAFEEGKGYKYYVEQAGGFGNRAKKSKAYIVYQNGTMAMAKKGKIEPGCEIIVPSKHERQGVSLAQWLGIGSTAASLATMAATIYNILK